MVVFHLSSDDFTLWQVIASFKKISSQMHIAEGVNQRVTVKYVFHTNLERAAQKEGAREKNLPVQYLFTAAVC